MEEERILTNIEKMTYLNALSKTIFDTQLQNLTRKQRGTLKLNLYLREGYGEFDHNVCRQLKAGL